MNKEVSTGTSSAYVKAQNMPDIESNPRLKEAINAFTGSNGGVKTHWTNTSISKRIGVIEQRSKANVPVLMLSMLSAYDDGSEALHSTGYGCTFHYGKVEMHSDKEKVYSEAKDDIEFYDSVFFIGCCLIHEVTASICDTIDMKEQKLKAGEILDKAMKIIPKMGSLKSTTAGSQYSASTVST